MDFIFDPSLVLYLPLHQLDGASFASRDAYGHLCTVTGAVWTPQGRTFDGVDDNIILPANWMPSTGTIEIWAKYDITLPHHIFSSDINEISIYAAIGSGAGYISFYYDDSSRFLFYGGVVTNTFVHIAIPYTQGGTGYLFTNGILKESGALPDVTPTNVATRLGEATSGVNDFTGTIGEVRIYSRALTPQEIQHNYLATKWRYR